MNVQFVQFIYLLPSELFPCYLILSVAYFYSFNRFARNYKVAMADLAAVYILGSVVVMTLLTLSCPSQQHDTMFSFSSPSKVLTATGGRIRGARNSSHTDFVIGGLFPIHTAIDGGGDCGMLMLEIAVEELEAMLYTIDEINADEHLLKGLTLGYDIRDTCSSENIALDEAVSLVITSNQLGIESCHASITSMNVTALEETPSSGIIGASFSHISVPVASLTRLFMTPQISYTSSSAILSNRNRYGYFYRTTPPDNFQAQAMIDLLVYFNWTYISTIYSQDIYGEPGITDLHTFARQRGICIDLNEGIGDNFSDEDFADIAEELNKSEANVVVLFILKESAENLFKQLEKISSRKFTWIGSDAWANSHLLASSYKNTVAGMFGFLPLTKPLQTFHEYFSRLTLNSNKRNPWFEEYFSAVMNCNNDESSNNTTPCNRNRSVSELQSYEQGKKIPLVVDAVYTYAYALQNFLKENCAQPVQWFSNNRTCMNQTRELNGNALLEYIKKVDFISPTGNRIVFDNQGNVEGKYDILNYQAIYTNKEGGTTQTEFVFKKVGIWDSSIANGSSLQFSPEIPFQFGLDSASKEVLTSTPVSQCSKCSPGQFQRLVQSSCCGFCDPCLGELFSSDPLALNCSKCEKESWGNDPMNGSSHCVSLKQSFLDFSHPYSIIIMIIALTGLVAVAFTLIVFIKFWNTPLVKSSGREQMILLLVGITLSFFSAFFLVSRPSAIMCGISRWIFWTSCSIMFSAILVKTVRVARIFMQKVQLKRPRFTEPHYQVLFTAVLVLLQLVILVISTFVDRPQEMREVRRNTEMPNAFPTVVITCLGESYTSMFLSFSYETLLIVLGTIFGVMSFTYPENFNEAKYVALCSISILVIWVAFIITFFATQTMQELRNIAISLALVMSGFAVLLCIFGHKVFFILFKPKRNISNWSKSQTNDCIGKMSGNVLDQSGGIALSQQVQGKEFFRMHIDA